MKFTVKKFCNKFNLKNILLEIVKLSLPRLAIILQVSGFIEDGNSSERDIYRYLENKL